MTMIGVFQNGTCKKQIYEFKIREIREIREILCVKN